MSNPSSISAGLTGQKNRTVALERSKMLSQQDIVSNDIRKDVDKDRGERAALRSEKPPRSKSKDKKVKFKEVFDTRNMNATKQER